MDSFAFPDRRDPAPAHPTAADASNEAAEVSRLLMRAGVDHSSALWFQLVELATQQACDWSERSAAAGAAITPRTAALLGVRSLATELLAADGPQGEACRDAADACLAICLELEAQASRPPPRRRRRWGEGAAPRPRQRPDLLPSAAGCC